MCNKDREKPSDEEVERVIKDLREKLDAMIDDIIEDCLERMFK